ncbi:MAG TPA: VgrG-related protein [Solirubrobacteraceae bacterium]
MSATSSEHYVSLYAILVDGSEIDEDLRKRVREVRVQSYLRLPDVCTLTAVFAKAEEGMDEPIDQHPFDIGKKLEVRLGPREGLTTTSLFKGEIVTLEPSFGAGAVELIVRGFDRSHVLLRSRNVRTFQNQTSSDIVSKIVQEAGFQADCDPSGDPHDFMQQDNETDWDFIWRLAERVGFEFVMEDQTAHFRQPTPDGAIDLEWPTTLRTFNPRVTAIQQVQQVTLRAQDPKSKQAIDVTASSSNQVAKIGVDRGTVASAFDGAKIHIATEPVKSQGEGKALAQALLDKLANGYVAAEGICDGDPDIKAGAKVSVSGVGQTFSGTYRVAAATHVLRGGGIYETHFANSAAHTLLGAVGSDRGSSPPGFGSQLVLGVVTNNDDPDGMGRVRVQYPALGSDVEGAWARVAVPSAGKERGLLMLPVPGEEVLIGFEHDDTTRPYVLGSLFNGRDTPGDDLLQGKDGSFALKSDQKIYTESKQDYTIKSGGKLAITTQDDVQEQYGADWNAQISGSATLKANQPFEIDGQNVTINGQAQISIQGNSSLTLSCGPAQIQLSSSGIQISAPQIQLG